MGSSQQQIKVFISYSSLDEEIATSIVQLLESLSVDFFLDKKEIDWGQPIETRIAHGIEGCSHLLVIISPGTVKSEWVPYEVGQARALGKSILPFLTHRGMVLPPFLAHLHYATSLTEIRIFFEKILPVSNRSSFPEQEEPSITGPSEKERANRVSPVEVFLSRSETPLRELLANAKVSIDMLVVLATALTQEFAREIVSALKTSKNIKLRVLALDPESSFAESRASQLGRHVSGYREEGRSAIGSLAALLDEFGDQSQIRVYSDMPMLILYRVDDILVLSPQTYSSRSRYKCHFVLPVRPGEAGEEFMFHFEALWTRSQILSSMPWHSRGNG